MGALADATRRFWLPGLNAISQPLDSGLTLWILRERFAVRKPPAGADYFLEASNRNEALSGFAYDCSRLGLAAIESAIAPARIDVIPRSVAWLLVSYYYAGFFAAHAILRMLGVSVSYLQSEHATVVRRVATNWSAAPMNISRGYHRFELGPGDELACRSLQGVGGSGGAHEALWIAFSEKVDAITAALLGAPGGDQAVGAKLLLLSGALKQGGRSNGNWPSMIRNAIQYRQEYDAWYPHKNARKSDRDFIYGQRNAWKADPMSMVLGSNDELLGLMQVSVFLLGWCLEMMKDMSSRCSTGQSFLMRGPLRLLNLYATSTAARETA